MNIVLMEPLGVSKELIETLSAPLKEMGHSFTAYDTKTTDADELIRRAKGAEILVIANNPLPEKVVNSLPDLKYLNVAFTGIDHVALSACKANKVLITNAANYSNQTVAELAVGMAVALLRKVVECDSAVRGGRTSAGLRGSEICGKTVGICGTGRIGTITAKLFLAFGANVIAYSRTKKLEVEALGVKYVTLEELMRQSDIISLHVPNNAFTRGMIGREQIAMMKKTALLINCARGPIVDNAALADALNAEQIAGAGIDVFDMEPPIPEDYPLVHAKNALLTPHVAFLSDESMIRRANIVFQNLYAYLKGTPKNVCEL